MSPTMASNLSLWILALVGFAFSFFWQGEIVCEHLGQDTCAFAVSSTAKRCVLEKHVKRTGEEAFTCKTSVIEAPDTLKDHIETEQCIKVCGLDRKSLGISSDSLLDSQFTQKLCSPRCYSSCPNIVDLYFNLAAGEVEPRPVLIVKLSAAPLETGRRSLMLIDEAILASAPY